MVATVLDSRSGNDPNTTREYILLTARTVTKPKTGDF